MSRPQTVPQRLADIERAVKYLSLIVMGLIAALTCIVCSLYLP